MRINTQRMQVDAVVSLPGNPYGLAIDGDGFLWTSERGGGWITKIDTTSAQLLNTYTPPFGRDFYGICTDAEKNVWIANFQQNNILKYVPSTNQWFQFRDPNARSTRGIAADSDGFIWVANSGSNNVSKFHARTGQLVGTYPAGSGPIGVAVDNLGNVWAVNQGSNNTTKFSPDGAVLGTYRVGSGPYTYSDMTGFQLRTFTLRQGRWVVNFDCGRPNCTFDALTWRASVPPGTQLELRARTSLDRVTWSSQEGPYGASPSPMSLPVGRYCEVEVRMSTDNDEISPVLQSVEVGWQRP
jgi:DNA-binding beta-propeller fold protein YncE